MSLNRKFLALALAIAAALPLASAQAEPFTLQGFLEQSGSPLNGNANLAFKLYDAQSGGTQQGATVSANAYPVLDGVFTIDLNFAGVAFADANRWLQVEVNGTPMGPRIEILPAPLAASARALQGRGVSATAPSSGQVLKWNGSAWAPAADAGGSSYTAGAGLQLNGTEFSASFGGSGAANSVARGDHDHIGAQWVGNSTSEIFEVANMNGFDTAVGLSGVVQAGTGVVGLGQNPGALGVQGNSISPVGVGVGVRGRTGSPNGAGVDGAGPALGVRAHSNATTGAATGLHASSASNSGKGVFAEAVIGVHGLSAEHPVAGTSVGVIGESTAASGTPSGVWGVAQGTSNASGVRGFGGGVGVIGEGVFQGTSGVATGSQGIGVLGKAIHSSGLVSGVQGEVDSPLGVAVYAVHNATTGQPKALAALTYAPSGTAVHATGNTGGIGVRAQTTGAGPAIVAENLGTTGLATALRAVGGSPNGTTSVFEATGGVGAWAIEARTSGSTGLGVYAKVDNASAGTAAAAVLGEVNSANAVAIRGVNSVSGGLAGRFEGNVNVVGTLSATTKLFRIDHPLDPANRYLQHIAIESDEMANLYSGNVVTDAKGYARVDLPAWFEALNGDFRYQLTVIGSFARAMVAEEVAGNRFAIRTDEPNTKVSWQVTGIRQDAWAERNRIPVELDKTEAERGKFLHPEAHGAPADKRIGVGDPAKPAR